MHNNKEKTTKIIINFQKKKCQKKLEFIYEQFKSSTSEYWPF